MSTDGALEDCCIETPASQPISLIILSLTSSIAFLVTPPEPEQTSSNNLNLVRTFSADMILPCLLTWLLSRVIKTCQALMSPGTR